MFGRVRAVVLQPDRSLAVEEVPDPAPAGGQVRVRVDACGICGSDLHMRPSPAIEPGQVMGHEFSGVIDALGPGSDRFAAGDRVCVYPFRPTTGHDLAAAMETGIGMGGLRQGGYAEAVCVPEEMVWALPEGMPLEDGALVEPLAVAIHSLNHGGIGPEDLCVVLGGGPIGVMHALALRLRGCERIVVIEPNPVRRERAAALGFTALDLESVHERAIAELGGLPSAVLECAGHPSAAPLAIELAAPSATVVLAGMLEEPVAISQLLVMLKELRLVGSFAYLPPDFDEALELIAAGRLPVDRIVTGREPLERADELFAELLRPETEHLKVLLRP